jgi:hypothetical protein
MPNWLAPTITAIKNQANEGGLLGMLDSAGGDGSIGSFLSKSSATAGSFAAISQNSVTNASSLVAQIASQNIHDANSKKLQDALASLSATFGSCPLCATSGHRRALFDHLVGPREHGRRHGETNRFGCLEVDHQLECSGLFDRYFIGLCTDDDLVAVSRQATKEFT